MARSGWLLAAALLALLARAHAQAPTGDCRARLLTCASSLGLLILLFRSSVYHMPSIIVFSKSDIGSRQLVAGIRAQRCLQVALSDVATAPRPCFRSLARAIPRLCQRSRSQTARSSQQSSPSPQKQTPLLSHPTTHMLAGFSPRLVSFCKGIGMFVNLLFS